MRSARTAPQVAFSVRAAAGEPWSTNFDIYEVAADGRHAAQFDRGQSRLGRAAGILARRHPARLCGHGPAGIRSRSLSSGVAESEIGREAPAHPELGSIDREFCLGTRWQDLFATTDHLGQRPLWAIDATTGRASAITGAGEVEGFSVGTRKVFYASSNLGEPADLYAVGFAGGEPAQLTHVNQAALAQRKFGEYEQFSFAGWNNENVFGYVVKPPDFNRDRKYPVAFLVHGGPQGSFANSWNWRWNAQTFAGAGYGVVMIDFHGSTGYGQAFTDSISGDWGGKPLEDLKLGLAAALEQNPWLDGDHACAPWAVPTAAT